MLTPWLVLVLAAAPVDAGTPALTHGGLLNQLAGGSSTLLSADGGFLNLLGSIGAFTEQKDDVVSLGPGVSTRKSLEDAHHSACGYEMHFHTLEVNAPDGGWTGFLGHSGSSGCPNVEWNNVDRAALVGKTIRITSGFARGPSHRAGRGAVLNLVPYQDFAVPRELGPIARLSAQNTNCLELVDRRGVFFEASAWCLQTTDAQTCLSVRNRCKGAIDAEGYEFTYETERWFVARGCVVPAGEHALVVSSQPGESPNALTFWTARCPSSPRERSE